MLNEDDWKKAIDALDALGEKTLKRIVREVILNKSEGEKADYPADIKLEIMNTYGSRLLENRDVRRIMVEECSKKRINILLERIGKNKFVGQKKDEIINEACIGRWVCGGNAALAFTQFFNFPASMAGESCIPIRFEQTEKVYAWQAAPKLHNYQKELKLELKNTLIKNGENRCMFTLPTGSGKTRIVVEFLVDYINECIKNDDYHELDRAFLWIAHSEELCEQAIESIKRVWETFGREGEPLEIHRHRGTHSIEGNPCLSGIIVASIQKIESTLNRNPGILTNLQGHLDFIIIDEAHRSTAPTYKKIFSIYGKTTKIIGITATPFRSSEKENKKLVTLYNSNMIRLKKEPNDFEWLSRNQYLSRKIKKNVLESGVRIDPNKKDIEFKNIFNEVSSRLLREISNDQSRNKKIVEKILELCKENKKILLFTCSVEHCYELQRMLHKHNTFSGVITGNTRPGRRQKYIEEFKNGSLNVLINFGVLTTGFDNPSIDVVFIARPTMSPVLYGQMIGRGIRGPKNGGTNECMVIDVADNIVNFDIQNSANYLDLWSETIHKCKTNQRATLE